MFHFFKTIQNGTFTIPEVFILTTIPARSSFVLVGTAIKKHFSRRCDFRKIYAMHFSVFENSVSHDERTKKSKQRKIIISLSTTADNDLRCSNQHLNKNNNNIN